ncbi:MAG: deoxyhypusine synthase family protein, partial [Elusimicrobia bacterium]|nr:deoxyhypusine synthase family protein [Elusimicrobiota bacterium]
LREACSWGKVDTVDEQMVFAEATLALPILASYGFHKGSWKKRRERRFNALLNNVKAPVPAALR